MTKMTEARSERRSRRDDRKEYGLPRFITLADGRRIDTRRGTIPQKSHSPVASVAKSRTRASRSKSSDMVLRSLSYAIQGYCPECDAEGRFTAAASLRSSLSDDRRRLVRAEQEWSTRRDADLADFWPRDEIPYSYMTHHANFALPKQGYTHWWKMFNSRQLLLLSELLRAILRCRCYRSSRSSAWRIPAIPPQSKYVLSFGTFHVTIWPLFFQIRITHQNLYRSKTVSLENWVEETG